jgi:hypothetical protein
MPVYFAMATMWFFTWMANSLVGVRIKALNFEVFGGNLNSGNG